MPRGSYPASNRVLCEKTKSERRRKAKQQASPVIPSIAGLFLFPKKRAA